MEYTQVGGSVNGVTRWRLEHATTGRLVQCHGCDMKPFIDWHLDPDGVHIEVRLS